MAKAHYYGLILAGGRGTRFWPRSRKRHAKQVLNVTGPRTLIQATVDRLAALIPPERIWILTNDLVRAEIVRQLPEVPQKQIISEPVQRNTAPAIALAAHILQSVDPDAVFGVFPSDAIIGLPKRFIKALKTVFKAAERGNIAVLGIKPRWHDTGYGYIEFPQGTEPGGTATYPVCSFREKPPLPVAKRYFKAGNYYWNSGMFFWKSSTVLSELRKHQPHTAGLIDSLPPFGHRNFTKKLAEVFPLCTNISIDYAVIEHAPNVVGHPCEEFGWSDVGSWDAVYDILPHDEYRNAARSELVASGSTGNYIDCGHKLVALLGVRNLIIVDTPDALLIAHRRRAQQVGDLVKLLEKNNREDLL